MMGHQLGKQAALFYEFSIDRHVPPDHLLRSIDRFVELDGLRRELSSFYSTIGRPSIAPELMIRMLLIGYCFGIRSERRLREEVHLNLAYRWFCCLGLDGDVPTIRLSQRTGMVVSAIAICCDDCLRLSCVAASTRGWLAEKALRSMPASSRRTRTGKKASRARRDCPHKPQAVPSTNTWPFWTMRPLAPRPRSSQSSSHRLIQPRAGPVPMADKLSLLTRPTI